MTALLRFFAAAAVAPVAGPNPAEVETLESGGDARCRFDSDSKLLDDHIEQAQEDLRNKKREYDEAVADTKAFKRLQLGAENPLRADIDKKVAEATNRETKASEHWGKATTRLKDLQEQARICDDDHAPVVAASVYVGALVDRFTADETKAVIDPEVRERKVQQVAGVHLSFDVLARTRMQSGSRRRLTLGVEAIFYGRNIEICTADTTAAEGGSLEGEKQSCGVDTEFDPSKFVKIVNDATAFEMVTNARFAPIGRAVRGFVETEGGFIKSDKSTKSFLGAYLVGIGFERFRKSGEGLDGSSIRVGYGSNQVFQKNSKHRLRASATLNYATPARVAARGETGGAVTLFAQVFVDTDVGPASDDVQIWFGVSFPVGDALRTIVRSKQDRESEQNKKPEDSEVAGGAETKETPDSGADATSDVPAPTSADGSHSEPEGKTQVGESTEPDPVSETSPPTKGSEESHPQEGETVSEPDPWR